MECFVEMKTWIHLSIKNSLEIATTVDNILSKNLQRFRLHTIIAHSKHVSRRMQNITGEYFVSTTPTTCNAGFLCNKGDHMADGGYEMAVAADGSLPLYACNPSNVRRVPVGDNTYAVGVETLGLGIPAGEKDTFTKLIVDVMPKSASAPKRCNLWDSVR